MAQRTFDRHDLTRVVDVRTDDDDDDDEGVTVLCAYGTAHRGSVVRALWGAVTTPPWFPRDESMHVASHGPNVSSHLFSGLGGRSFFFFFFFIIAEHLGSSAPTRARLGPYPAADMEAFAARPGAGTCTGRRGCRCARGRRRAGGAAGGRVALVGDAMTPTLGREYNCGVQDVEEQQGQQGQQPTRGALAAVFAAYQAARAPPPSPSSPQGWPTRAGAWPPRWNYWLHRLAGWVSSLPGFPYFTMRFVAAKTHVNARVLDYLGGEEISQGHHDLEVSDEVERGVEDPVNGGKNNERHLGGRRFWARSFRLSISYVDESIRWYDCHWAVVAAV
ncbi:hypothetical protein F4780DRAFT_778925 [Xylariomycetidae sp. FL0641]|nr:hypothetical protein F4780DRAFT_778925 [Xylariomycetidae sp. FL0641]